MLTELEKEVAVQTPFVNIGKHRWRAGKNLAHHLDLTGSFPAATYSNVLSEVDGFRMCDFIADICRLGWKPNHVHEYECGGQEHKNPRLLRDIKKYPLWKLYQGEQDKRDALAEKEAAAKAAADAAAGISDLADPAKKIWRPGRGTFMLLVDHLTIEMKNKSCLSYFYVRMVQCFTDQVQFIDYLLDVVKAGNDEWEATYGSNKNTCPMKPTIPHA